MFAYTANNPVMGVDPSGYAWWHWGVAAAVVVGFAILTVATCGGSLVAAGTAMSMASSGVAYGSLYTTVAAFATAGSAYALGGAVFNAAANSNSWDDFADHGGSALAMTVTGGAYGALGGYISWNQQIRKEPGSWTKKRADYWKANGESNGRSSKGLILHHTYGRFGAKEDIFYPVTRTEHVLIHRLFGYGNGSGGFNMFVPWDNPWNIFDYLR